MEGFRFSLKIGQDDFHIGIELRKHLSACAAGRYGFLGVGNNGDFFKLPTPIGDCRKNGIAFRTDGQSETDVFHIASVKNTAIRR